MSAKPVVQMFSGAASVHGAKAYLDALQERRDQWPYVHIFPPPNSQDVNVIGSAATVLPATGYIEVVRYQVNSGKRFFLTGVVLGSNVSFAPGDALFTVDRNSAIGMPDTQFQPEHGLVNVPLQLGSFTFGEWKLRRAREFAANDVVRVKALNVALNVGVGNFYACGLFGFEVPSLDIKLTK